MKNKIEFSKAVSLTKKNESLTLYNSAQQRVDPGKNKGDPRRPRCSENEFCDHGSLAKAAIE